MCSRTRSGKRATSKPATSARPPLGRKSPREDSDRRRLAGAVGAEKADDFAAPRLEADLVHRDEGAEPLRQTVGDDLDLAHWREAHPAGPPVRSETNRSSIDGATRSISSILRWASASARLDRAGPQSCIVDHDTHAVAHEGRAQHALEPGDDRAGLARRVGGDCDDFARHQRFQRLGRVAIEHLARTQETQPGAAFGFVEIGRRNDDRDALASQSVENAPEIAARDRIDAGGRLIEQQNLRRMYERAGQPELLLHAAGQLPGAALAERRHARSLKEARRALVSRAPVDAEQVGEEFDVLVDREILVKPEALGHVADVRSRQLGVGDDIDSFDRDRTLVRRHHRRQQAHDCRFSGAVRADEAEDFALGAVQTQSAHRRHAAEALGQVADLDRRSGRRAHDWPGARTGILASAGRPGTSSCEGLSMSMRIR